MEYADLINNLIACRKSQNITLVELAQTTNVSRQALHNIETFKKTASDETLQKMCQALNLELEIVPKQYNIKPKK